MSFLANNMRNPGSLTGLFLILLLTIQGCTGVQVPDEYPATLDEISLRFDERLPYLMDLYDIPGSSIALIRNGEVVLTKEYGYANLQTNTPVDIETLFRAESITKMATAMGIMKLAGEGYFDLDDPVENHLESWTLPDLEFEENLVTIRQLLSHSSGMTGGTERRLPGMEQPPLTETLDGKHGLHEAKLVRKPGTDFEYSNQGFILLEVLAEDVTGKVYGEFIRESVLEPLSITEFAFSADPDIPYRVATSYNLSGDPLPQYSDLFRSAGGLLINAENLARVIASLMEGPNGESPGRGVLSPESIAELHTPVIKTTGFYGLGSDSAGLGHFIEVLPNGLQGVFHGGEGAGSLGKVYLVPETGDGIVLLTNSKRSWPFLFESLGEWAVMSGLPQPAMSRNFNHAYTGVRAATILFFVAALFVLWRLFRGVVAQKRYFHPAAEWKKRSRIFKAALSLLMIPAWWAAGTLFVNNLLPVTYGRLGGAIAIFAAAVLISVMFPEDR